MSNDQTACKAWLLDLDGTLYRHAPVRIAMAFELLLRGRRTIRVIQQFRREHELLRSDNPTTADPYREQISRTARATNLDVEVVASIIDEWFIERPRKWIGLFRRRHLIAEIRRFKTRGGKVAVVSDYPARRKLNTLGLMSTVDAIVANGEEPSVRRLKPCPDGYVMVAMLLELAPGDCLVIGDRADADGTAARAAGMAFRIADSAAR
jgi:FMN phosphatase YigB (HAD superfamily)